MAEYEPKTARWRWFPRLRRRGRYVPGIDQCRYQAFCGSDPDGVRAVDRRFLRAAGAPGRSAGTAAAAKRNGGRCRGCPACAWSRSLDCLPVRRLAARCALRQSRQLDLVSRAGHAIDRQRVAGDAGVDVFRSGAGPCHQHSRWPSALRNARHLHREHPRRARGLHALDPGLPVGDLSHARFWRDAGVAAIFRPGRFRCRHSERRNGIPADRLRHYVAVGSLAQCRRAPDPAIPCAGAWLQSAGYSRIALVAAGSFG